MLAIELNDTWQLRRLLVVHYYTHRALPRVNALAPLGQRKEQRAERKEENGDRRTEDGNRMDRVSNRSVARWR
ncbi:hypothetical protein SAMN05216283_105215 [Sunxiuqinia elliptica]|uniref:Uncharacterized protein n=1 Tax=Sunxiuqinia elliptica TaxID=655355 RepID=A0A1I2IF27_9BACT|nr:hypothetical protein SAMN05216283_105215 [Sunxiuqinia elliptica]